MRCCAISPRSFASSAYVLRLSGVRVAFVCPASGRAAGGGAPHKCIRKSDRRITATMRFVYLLSALLIASASAFAPQSAVRSTGIVMNAAKQSDEVVNFKKPEFVASVSEKTGLSKAESEAALAAVLETIQEVSEVKAAFLAFPGHHSMLRYMFESWWHDYLRSEWRRATNRSEIGYVRHARAFHQRDLARGNRRDALPSCAENYNK